MISHNTTKECYNEAQAQLHRATSFGADQWMACVFYLRGGRLIVEETTCDFPIVDHQNVLSELKKLLNEKSGARPAGPLPLAQHIRAAMADVNNVEYSDDDFKVCDDGDGDEDGE